ncbi:A-kinase anchor protein 9 isoform X2 [Xenopus laevis]|uniref:A-kinase anchor protein 9 isoform X2 n=1 Tax=Xenopus laevis TaxID=8355 RepID=A0A8J1KWZ3_XENLA|nr:A-kinase anchor protein 9 isoform X2 [Xenopus laevis]
MEEEEDQERKRKLEAGKAKLAQFRQRKDGQHPSKKPKKKKSSAGSKGQKTAEDAQETTSSHHGHSQSTDGAAATEEFSIMRTLPHGETIKHDKTYTVEHESEISSTADDYSSEVTGASFLPRANSTAELVREEEEFEVRETFSEHGTCSSLTRLEVMEDELAGKQQEIEELNKELEEMRAAYGTQGLQQLQEFETAIKQRDDIITQLTTNLQEARKEKDEIMKEFLELTEQSQKLKIQFQHLQASEALRNNSHTSTAADLLQSKQQMLTYHQQLEEQERQLKLFQKDNESYKAHNVSLQAKIQDMEQLKELELLYERKLNEKDVSIDNMKTALEEEERKSSQLTERISLVEKSAEELRQELVIKNQEINNLTEDFSTSKQRERQSSEEVKLLMGTVEELQRKHYKGNQSEADVVQRMELEAERKLDQLRAELDEMYGQQIVQMKQALIKQHASEIEKLLAQHKAELDNISTQSTVSITNEQINELSITINQLNAQLQHSKKHQSKMKEDFFLQIKAVSSEKSLLQGQIKDLLQDLSLAREQIEKAKESITEKESKLSEASSLLVTTDDLKAELAAVNAYMKELETKHEAEITNYKIKLDMLEREKDAVLDRMAESQEAELEKLRTHFLFSQEEELSKLREDLTREHSVNIENLKQNLDSQFRQQLDNMQQDMSQTIITMQCEKDSLVTKKNNLMLEISKLKDLLHSVGDPRSEEMMIQMNELQKELEPYKMEEKEKETTEQDFEMLQLKIKLLEKEVKEKDALDEQIASLKVDIRILRDENNTLQTTLKNYSIIGSVSEQSDDKNPELRNEIEKLTLEIKQLHKLEFILKEEIERQKNTFSFAEKNFEVNFHELQEEYTCLLKIKEQLEDRITKREEEYSTNLNSLNKELAKLKGICTEENLALKDIKHEVPGPPKLVKADALEAGEVVEKDTTELMEKLEIAQRDKHELSLKLSDLSEQMQLKQNEINLLKEHVKSLCQERDNALSDHQKDKVIGMKETLSVQSDKKSLNNRLEIMSNEEIDKSDTSLAEESLIYEVHEDIQHLNNCSLSHLSPETCDSKVEEETEFTMQRLHELSHRVDTESALLVRTQKERDGLQQELHYAQADLKLQLEAQRISLTQIYNAHIELINENMQKHKEDELCSLKKEMLKIQELKTKELQDVHQQDLQALQLPKTGGDSKSCQILIELLIKRISNELNHINENINRHFLEKKPENMDGTENKESSLQESSCPIALEQHLTEVQAKYAQMTHFLKDFLKEYQQITQFYSNPEIEKDQTIRDDLEGATTLQSLTTMHSPVGGIVDVQGAATSRSHEVEKLKIEFSHQRAQLEEKHSQEIEHLRFYFQQQLKENEERYTTEIIHLQEHIQNVSETSLDFRELSKMQSEVEEALHEADILKSLSTSVTDTEKMDEQGQAGDKPVKRPIGPIYEQLQTLRQASYSRYLEEVSGLKKQHEAELIQLREDLNEKYYQENATLKEQIKLLTKTEQDNSTGNFEKLQRSPVKEEGKTPADINQLLEERYQERIQEEVAKVIVEMTVAFAQKSELARLAAPMDSRSARNYKGSQETAGATQKKEEEHQPFHEEEKSLQVVESSSLDNIHIQDGTDVPHRVTRDVAAVIIGTPNTSLSQEQNSDLHPKHQEKNVTVDSHFNEKTVVLKEEDYNRMLAMGAENAKLRPLYEEHVEDMRQELVRLEQEHQQSVEAMKYAHMEQLERQMYDQEQLLSELHVVRAQLIVNTSMATESQASETEALSEDSQSPETEENPTVTVWDNSSLTLEEHVEEQESESKDEFWDGISKKEDGNNDESEDAVPDDPICDRKHLIRTNKQFLKILLEIVKTTSAVEETIGHHVLGLLDKPGRRSSASQAFDWNPGSEDLGATFDLEAPKTSPIVLKDFIGSTEATEEELDLFVHLTDRGLAGDALISEDQAQVLHISTRLQAAVEKLLEAINETNNQLEHAKAAQTELVRESIKRKQETANLLQCQEELQERLNEEAKAREHLALELSRAEGLLDGYSDERVFLEKQIQEKNDLVQHMEQELQRTGNRLQEFEQERQQLQEERELLSRQKIALRAEAEPVVQRLVEAAVDAAPTEELMEESEKLLKERIEVQRQAEKDSGDLYKQVKVLETELEEQMSRNMEIEQEKNLDLEDLRQKNLSLEKQLEKTRKFLDEQAVDREHERDVFQQEILQLEQQLKMPQRHQPVTDHQSNALEKLETNLKEKTDKCNELLLCKEQFQRDIQERNEEIEKLECRIRELEQALLTSDDTLKKVELRRQSIIISSKGEMPLEAQLQVERDAIDRKENEITNLEEQLEQFREELENKNEEVQQLHMQLEIQRKESSTRLLELEQENKVLKDENVEDDDKGSPIKTHHMKPEVFEQVLLLKEQEIDQLNEQVGRLQAQLETATDNKIIEDKNNQIKEYKSQIKCLKSDQERLKRNSEEEIEKLNEIIEKLQDELANIDSKVSVDFTSMTEDSDSSKHQLEAITAEKDLLQQKMELSDTELAITRTALDKTKAEMELLKKELNNVREGQIADKRLDNEVEATSEPLANSLLQELQQIIREKNLELLQYYDKVKLLEQQSQVIEQLNEDIRKLQVALAEKEESTVADSVFSIEVSGNSEYQNKTDEEEMSLGGGSSGIKEGLQSIELEETQAKLKSLKEELEKLKQSPENTSAVIEKLEDTLREKTAELLTSQALLDSVQETVQSTMQNLESQVQSLQKVVKEKDAELLQYAVQKELLEKQEVQIEQLNGIIENLRHKLDKVEQSHVPEKVERDKDFLTDQMQNKLLQNTELNGEEATFLKIELENAQAEVKLLRDELSKLHASLSKSEENLREALSEKVQLLENQALSASAEEAMKKAMKNMESQLQELQIDINKKDLELLQCSNEIELLEEQVKTQRNHNDEVILAMENTLREKVAAALVSEAQVKAIQVHSKLMRQTDLHILQEESKGTQTSKSHEKEVAETNFSVLSLRLLQLEKQLSDLHEELQAEREHAVTANQQIAEKDKKLAELQQLLDCTNDRSDERILEETPDAAKLLHVPSQGSVAEEQLERLKAEAKASREELAHYREVAEKLKEELLVKEASISHLEEDLCHVRKCLMEAEEQLKAHMIMEAQQAEEKQLRDDLPGSLGNLEPTPLETKTSSSQTEKTQSVNNSNQTPPIHLTDTGVQNVLDEARWGSTSDDVAAIIKPYIEKIEQMQDLHAAEILDMEARHISEADSLRTDQYVAVQALTEECEALKAVIGSMRATAGPVKPDSLLPTPYQFTDTTSSDTGSDWSQGAYVPNFESVPDGVRSDDEVTTDLFPNKIKNLLRAVHQESIQVLSLTEPDGADDDSQSFPANLEPWLKERKTLLETIASLKDLIGKMQIHKEAKASASPDLYDLIPDWRGELLRAIQEVFDREQDVMISAFHTQLTSLGTCDAATLVNHMQHRLQEQGMEQINAMDCIQNADRRSLLLEVQDLRSQLLSLRNDVAAKPLSVSIVEDMSYQNLENDHAHQIQDLHLQLNRISVKSSELEEQLNSERHVVAEVKNELAQTKIELESTLSLQHKHFKELESLRLEIKQRSDDLDAVSEALANEQKKARELQWALEKEKSKVERSEERGKEELEDLKMLFETQNEKIMEISNLLENEKQMVKDLQERIASREITFDAELSQEKSKASELQAFLDEERNRCKELTNALDCRTKLHTQLQKCEGGEQSDSHSQADDLLKGLQSQLEAKHHRIVELVGEMESYKLECVQLRQSIDEEKQNHRKQIEAENDSGKAAHVQAQELKAMVDDLQQKLNEKTLQLLKVKAEEKHLKETIHRLENNNNQQVVAEQRSERRELGASTSGWKSTIDTPRSNGHQQIEERSPRSLRQVPSIALNGDYIGGGGPFSVETIRQRLQRVSDKLKHLSNKASQRIQFEDVDHEDLTWSKSSIQEIIFQLGQVAVLSLDGENFVFPPGISTNTLTEKLLTQNAELTGYVSRLTEEKNDLRNALLRLEEEACRHRLRGPSGDHSFGPLSVENTTNIDILIASERELWTREKLRLQQSLKLTEAELSKVKAELRIETTQRDSGRGSENTALKRVYSKYLRAESFRKALVYQKKYLLLLLGGFQECEDATLALIGRMGGQPSYTDLEVITHHTRAFTRFRSAVRVSIAISRMKFLVRRWQRATGSSPSSINRNVFGQITGNELRTESPYPPSGSLDNYGEQRHLACRSRSEFDSPQSTVNSQHRNNTVSDASPSSYLRNYDPDRALTDYITRLEALQKRLGSVHTGSTNTSHHTTRR